MKKPIHFVQLLLAFFLFTTFSGCGSDKDNKVYHRKESLVCDYNSCSNQNVYCKIISYRLLDCDIFIHKGEKNDSKNDIERNNATNFKASGKRLLRS